ncbi:MAG: cytochrome c3 family protein [Deltaproteobacteria bacterium]|nr:cytochrome c3 family protein [Deltaproteobacteria bacterium]
MKNRSLLIISVIVGIACLLVSQGVLAGTDVQKQIKMENRAYAKHKKGIVMFSHKKHSEEYAKQFPDIYENSCGECHHDKNNAPLVGLKAGDNVRPCIECHSKPGERPKGKGAPKLSSSEKLQYHAEAIHANCKACHKAVNKKTGRKSAPTTCSKCHPKK